MGHFGAPLLKRGVKMINKQIINRVDTAKECVGRRKENDIHDCTLICENTTKVITKLLRHHTVGFETYDNRLYTGSYKGYKQIAKTPIGVVLFHDLVKNIDVELRTSEIKIVRVFD